MKRRAGKLVGQPITETTRLYNPLVSTYIKVPVRNINLEVILDIPSKEGLTIRSEVSILYRLDPEKVPTILRDVGISCEQNLISPVFRSALADVQFALHGEGHAHGHADRNRKGSAGPHDVSEGE